MFQNDFVKRCAGLMELRTSVNAEFMTRINRVAEVRTALGRDNAALAAEFCLLADLDDARQLLTGAVDWYATNEMRETAEDFARGTLRDCGVPR
jgi:hypothetical protein